MDKFSYRILKAIYKRKPINENLLLRKTRIKNIDLLRSKISFLTNNGYLENNYFVSGMNNNSQEKCYVTAPKGDDFVESQKTSNFRFWVPIIISIIAMILSVIGLGISWMSLMKPNSP